MPSVSNIAVGALVAGSAASKARHRNERVNSSFINRNEINVWWRCSGSISC